LSGSPKNSPKSKAKRNDDISGIDKGEMKLKKENKPASPIILDIEAKAPINKFYVEWLIE